eukprot:TRINITY_DN8446_c0_g1_i1.p1 TRINITY_DN8446_c0_g1~~TRINITY_DN8446_c0_g1_i1.p1  ORF type:complete len:842 (+),score=194.74 TRINITY_DN8446_c0_g1_i1:109-2634(+)
MRALIFPTCRRLGKFPKTIGVGTPPLSLQGRDSVLPFSLRGSFVQHSETDRASLVIVHFPGKEAFFGSLNPRGNLYDQPFNTRDAEVQFRSFAGNLRASGAQVMELKRVLATHAPKEDLVDLALSALSYEFHGDTSTLSDESREFVSRRYKKSILERMYPADLVDTILLRPSVVLESSDVNTGLRLRRTEVRPLTNLMFTRDQQIVTPRGAILTNLTSSRRDEETRIVRAMLHAADIPYVGHIEDPGQLEGGDFFMLDASTAIVSVGLRSNFEAVRQLMANNWLGARRLLIVVDEFDQNQQRMHLDTIFNVVSTHPRRVCVALESAMAGGSLPPRTVVEYRRVGDEWTLWEETLGMEWSEVLREHLGFEVIPVDDEFQAQYGINFINLGANRVLSVNAGFQPLLRKHDISGINVTTIDFDQCTSMFGAARCCSQVFRTPNIWDEVDDPYPYTATLPADITGAACLSSTELQLADPGCDAPPEAPEVASVGRTRVSELALRVPRAVVMVRPVDFGFNEETATSNVYQQRRPDGLSDSLADASSVRARAMHEFDGVVATLRTALIDVVVMEPSNTEGMPDVPLPDAVFPNNWFLTTATGSIYLFPMATPNRIAERRPQTLMRTVTAAGYSVRRIIRVGAVRDPPDPQLELEHCLEGTGALVFDRLNHMVFGALSSRCSLLAMRHFALEIGHDFISFDTKGSTGAPVYHTNVVMGIGTDWAVVCFECFVDPADVVRVRQALSRKDIIEITVAQMEQNFCGNILELADAKGEQHIIMSQSAYAGFTDGQRGRLAAHASIIVCEIPTIEKVGGGSLRCMLAELTLPKAPRTSNPPASRRTARSPSN